MTKKLKLFLGWLFAFSIFWTVGAYSLTNADQKLIDTLTERFETIIQKGWEDFRPKIMSALEVLSKKPGLDERISLIFVSISESLKKPDWDTKINWITKSSDTKTKKYSDIGKNVIGVGIGKYWDWIVLSNWTFLGESYGWWRHTENEFSRDRPAKKIVSFGWVFRNIYCILGEDWNVDCFGDSYDVEVYFMSYKGWDAKDLFLWPKNGCVIRNDNSAHCWWLDNRTNFETANIEGIYQGKDIKKIAISWDNICMLLDNGNVKCYGDDTIPITDYDLWDAVDIFDAKKSICLLLNNWYVKCNSSRDGFTEHYKWDNFTIAKMRATAGFCGIDKSKNLICYKWNYGFESERHIMYNKNDAIDFDGSYFYWCVINDKGNVSCRDNWYSDDMPNISDVEKSTWASKIIISSEDHLVYVIKKDGSLDKHDKNESKINYYTH